MTCHYCKNTCKRFGKHRNGLQHFRCRQCKRTFTEEHEKPLDGIRLSNAPCCTAVFSGALEL